MNASQIYLVATIIVLAVVAILMFIFTKNKAALGLHPLSGLAFAFILSGLLFPDDRTVGYGLMGVGVVIAVIDIVKRSKTK